MLMKCGQASAGSSGAPVPTAVGERHRVGTVQSVRGWSACATPGPRWSRCHRPGTSLVSWSEAMNKRGVDMTEKTTHVVVLGAGYAGLMAAMRLANKTDSRAVAITLVNATETFNKRVRNHQLISGQRLPERPLAQMLSKTRIQFQPGTVRAVEPDRRAVIVETGADETIELPYDNLIYALGSHVNVGATPGVHEHAYTLDQHSAAALAPLLPDL